MEKTITVPFRPHFYQDQVRLALKRFSVAICHRRFGKSVLVTNLLIKWALQTKRENWRAGYIAPLYRQAEEIAWDYLQRYSSAIPGIQYNKAKLRADFPNGARISLFGADNPDSLRGPYWDAVVFDEYAQIRPKVWPEIIRPALTDRKGWAIFIGTPQGHDHFWELWKKAQGDEEWATLMYKVSQTNILDPEELARTKAAMSPEQYEQEFECSFEAALIGAYYGPLIQDAVDEKRITTVPHEPILPVHTAWDLGVDDSTVIWFFQLSLAGEIRLIDYHEENGKGLDHYARLLQERRYVYGQHLGPHDIKVRELSSGRSRIEIAQSLGIAFTVVPMIPVADGIQAVRSILPRCWFDEKKSDYGIQALKMYRKEYSDRLSTFRSTPLHDRASHGADAFRTLAVGLELIQPSTPTLKIKMPALQAHAGNGWMM